MNYLDPELESRLRFRVRKKLTVQFFGPQTLQVYSIMGDEWSLEPCIIYELSFKWTDKKKSVSFSKNFYLLNRTVNFTGIREFYL